MDIGGANALVAGGASGLGAATARRLHAHGAAVVIADIDVPRGERLAAELGAAFVEADVRSPEHLLRAVERTAEAPAGLRVAIACAGTDTPQRIATANGPAHLRAVRADHRHQLDRDVQRVAAGGRRDARQRPGRRRRARAA